MKGEIGKSLKKMRMMRGLTQKELAAKVKGGLDYTYIGKIERGEQLPSLKILIKISEALSVPIVSFFRNERGAAAGTGSSADLGYLAENTQGRELLKTLRHLHQDDVQLVSEIIKVLNRHRMHSADKTSEASLDCLVAAENDPTYRK